MKQNIIIINIVRASSIDWYYPLLKESLCVELIHDVVPLSTIQMRWGELSWAQQDRCLRNDQWHIASMPTPTSLMRINSWDCEILSMENGSLSLDEMINNLANDVK